MMSVAVDDGLVEVVYRPALLLMVAKRVELCEVDSATIVLDIVSVAVR